MDRGRAVIRGDLRGRCGGRRLVVARPVAGAGGDRGDRAAEGGGAGTGLRGGRGGPAARGRRSAQSSATGACGSCVSGDAGAVADRGAGFHAGVGFLRGDSGALGRFRGLAAEIPIRRAGRGEELVRRRLWRGPAVFFRWTGEQFAYGPDRASAGRPRRGFARAAGLGGGFDGLPCRLRGLHFHLDRHAVEFDRAGAQGRALQGGALRDVGRWAPPGTSPRCWLAGRRWRGCPW
jgi:hypothetical protein